MHLRPHLSTLRSAWFSRTLSGLEGNPSAASSGVAGSATSSSVEAGSAASSAPGSDDPVDGIEPVVLQLPIRAETTISGGRQQAHYGHTRAACFRQEEVDSAVFAVCE